MSTPAKEVSIWRRGVGEGVECEGEKKHGSKKT
jgi:hypothetical protein